MISRTPIPSDPTPVSASSSGSSSGLAVGWLPEDGARLYRVADWGGGYFDVTPEGTVAVRPGQTVGGAIDLLEVVRGLRDRDLSPPLLLRFPDVTAHRMARLQGAFAAAIDETAYQGEYACVYPIKVNQARHVCEEVRDIGARLGFGLEVGTKPELLAAMALTEGLDAMPIVCNGFKDEEFLEAAVLATKLGRTIFPVIERFVELEMLLPLAKRAGIRPRIGVRAKLASQGTGRWQSSAGERGKFGLATSEMLAAVDLMRERDMLDCLCLLHCHIGSQVSDIRSMKHAVSELAHIYVELVRLGAPMGWLDFGGGAGVDYDGTSTPTEFSTNYDLDEYAQDVVYRVASVCDSAGVPHPNLVSESGRAMTAYSSVLVCEVLGARVFDPTPDVDTIRGDLTGQDEPPRPLVDLLDAYDRLGQGEGAEIFHDTTHAREEAANLFRLGYLTLADHARAEELSLAIYRGILAEGEMAPSAELDGLQDALSDIYFCNFSLFQSLPDSWAIDQLFPIMPIHRLDERPDRRGILADVTCDSDGKIDNFVSGGGVKRSLELHSLDDGASTSSAPYYLGIFLVGAYQETLGDLHNLLGDVHAAHVSVDPRGGWNLDTVVEGDTVREVLTYVQFDVDEMRASVRRSVEESIRSGRLTVKEGNLVRRFYHEALEGYTYPE